MNYVEGSKTIGKYHKYKVAEIRNLEFQSSMRNLQELNFDWFYYNYDGCSKQTYVTVYRRSEPSGISTRFIIEPERIQRDLVYDCYQINKCEILNDTLTFNKKV